jgi:hypothetical protein
MPRLLSAGLKACTTAAAVAVILGFAATPVASAQQSFNVYIGGFTPRAEDARKPSDVLIGNLDRVGLDFNIGDFNSAVFGGEYLVGFGDKFDAGLGIGFQQRSVPTLYRDLVNIDGSEIEQTLKLRVFPMTATVRFLPLGHHGVAPYLGAGVGIFAWRYSERGDFVRDDNSIQPGTFVGTGSATGPVVLGGIRVGVDNWGVGGELRHQSAKGDLPSDQGFAGTKIDLGGFTYLFSVNFRF